MTLVKSGFTLEELYWEMTPEEIGKYYVVAVKETTEAMRRTAIAVRLGFGADKAQWKRFMSELDGKNEPKKGVISQEFLQHLQALQQTKGRGAKRIIPGRVPKRPTRPV